MAGHAPLLDGRWLWSEGWQQQQHHVGEEEEDADPGGTLLGPVPRHASPPYVVPLEGDHALSVPSIDGYRMSMPVGESEVATLADIAGGHTSQQDPWLDFLERAQSAEAGAAVACTTSLPAVSPRLEDTSAFLERLSDPEAQASPCLEPEPEDVPASSSKDASSNALPPKRPRLQPGPSRNQSLGSSDRNQLASVNCDQQPAHSGKALKLTASSDRACALSQQGLSGGQTEPSTLVNAGSLGPMDSKSAQSRPDAAAQPSSRELLVDALRMACGGPETESSAGPSRQGSGPGTKASTDGLLDTAGGDTIQYALILQQHGLIPLARSFQQMSLQPPGRNPQQGSRAKSSLLEPPQALPHDLTPHRPPQAPVLSEAQSPGRDPPKEQARPASQQSDGPSAAQIPKVQAVTTPTNAAPATSSLSLRLAQAIRSIKRPTPTALPGWPSDQHRRGGEPEERANATQRAGDPSSLFTGGAALEGSFRLMPDLLHSSATLGPPFTEVQPHGFPRKLLGKQGADTHAPNSRQLLSPACAASLHLLARSGRAVETGVMQRLQTAAQAVEDGKVDVFKSIAESLRWLAQPAGDALGRLTAMMLKALSLRIRGEAVKNTSRLPKHVTQQDLVEGRQWLFAATPFAQWLCAYAGSMLLPHLRGHREVLLLLWSDPIVLSLPGLMQALATGSGNTVLGPHARLEHIRVTIIDHNDLVFPGRNDFVNVRAWGMVQSKLEREAAALGIKLEFTVLFLNVHNLDMVDTIERKAGEGFAFCGTIPFAKSSGDPSIGDGSRVRVMQAVQRLRPNVVCLVEEDYDGTLGNMPQRFRACMEHYERFLRANDACSGVHRRKRVVNAERGNSILSTFRIVGCEGQDRMVRPLSRAQWDKFFALFSLEALPVDPTVADTLDRLLTRFPQGFSSQPDDHWLCLCWEGVPIIVGSCWVPSLGSAAVF